MRLSPTIALALAALLLVSLAGQRFIRQPHICLDRRELTQSLRSVGESLRGWGIKTDGGISELWVREKDPPTWSIIVTLPNGDSCLAGDGTYWTVERHKHQIPGEPL